MPAVSSPGAPHRGGGLPASKPGLDAGTRDSTQPNRGATPERSVDTSRRLRDLVDHRRAGTSPRSNNALCPQHIRDPPRTRQSLLILAAFRPWGGSQDGRRTGGRRASLRQPRPGSRTTPRQPQLRRPAARALAAHSHRPVSCLAEDSPSGLGRTIGNRVGLTPSGVQIPYPPPGNFPYAVKGIGRCGAAHDSYVDSAVVRRGSLGPVADERPSRARFRRLAALR